MELDSKLVRFGPNELDLTGYQLKRGGVRVPLSRLPLDLLILLIKRPGALVTREEIAAHLWERPELVDTVGGINTAIKKIRAVLNDDVGQPRYIETVVGRGYRFIGQIVNAEEKPAAAPDLMPVTLVGALEELLQTSAPAVAEPRKTGRWRWAAAILVAALLAGAALWKITMKPVTQPLHRVQVTSNDSEDLVTASAISPDGKLLVYADSYGLWLREVKSGATHQLKAPEKLDVTRIAWFPDGLRVVVSGTEKETGQPQIWLGSLLGAAPVLIRVGARNGAPAPDGERIASIDKDGTEIWITDALGGAGRRLLAAQGESKFLFVFWLPDGRRLGYQKRSFEPRRATPQDRGLESNYDWRYEAADAESGKVLSSTDGLHFESAACTRDGHMWFVRSLPTRHLAGLGIWEARIDPHSGRFLATPRRRAELEDQLTSNLSISADGQEIATVMQTGQADVFVGDLHKLGPALNDITRLTLDTRNDYPQAWTADSKAVIFESDREGDYHLYRQELDRHTAESLVAGAGEQIVPQLTPDSRWFLYQNTSRTDRLHDALYRLPVEGGAPTQIKLDRPLDEFRCPAAGAPRQDCVLRETEGRDRLVFYALDPVEGKRRQLAWTKWVPTIFLDWTISPDGTRVAIPLHESARPRLRVVSLDWTYAGRHEEQEIETTKPGELWNLSWSADGLGWYAEVRAQDTSSLEYIDLHGNMKLLRQVACNTWGVPSPDEKRLAFVDCSTEQNVWIWKQAAQP